MEDLFSIGELAHYQNISKQTLIYYDKIGLFRPMYTDPNNGYRYYSTEQIDYLDTILIMKKIGFSLQEIKEHMKDHTTANSLVFLRQQLDVIDHKIKELSLIRNRLQNRCEQVEQAFSHRNPEPVVAYLDTVYLLCQDVEQPCGIKEISIATKQCYAQAFRDDLPIFFQSGISVPLKHILSGHCTKAAMAFVTTDNVDSVKNIKTLPPGLTVSIYHFGNYYESIGYSYRRLLEYCFTHNLEITSDSYEFCVNDYITSRNEEEFITKIVFYVREKGKTSEG